MDKAEAKRRLKELEEAQARDLLLQTEHAINNRVLYFTRFEGIPDPHSTLAIPKQNFKQSLLLDAMRDPDRMIFTYTGSNRCLGGEVEIYDPVKKVKKPVSEINEPFHVLAWDGKYFVTAKAEKPFTKPVGQLYRIGLSSGHSFVASGDHLVFSGCKYVPVSELLPGYELFRPPSNSDTCRSALPVNALSFLKKASSFLFGCLVCHRWHDGRLLHEAGGGQGVFPLQDDVHVHKFFSLRLQKDGQENTQEHTRLYRQLFRPSIQDGQGHFLGRFFGFLSRIFCKTLAFFSEIDPSYPQPSIAGASNLQSSTLNGQHQSPSFSTFLDPPYVGVIDNRPTTIVTSIRKERVDVKWDFHVPIYNNYYAEGAIHHNCGKTASWGAVVPCYCAGEWLWDREKICFSHGKPRKIRIVGQDWEKHISTVVVPALREWWPKERPVTVKKNNVGVDAFWTDEKSGSTIEIMSNRQESELFEGWHGDLIIYDEPPRRDVRVACARGLIDRRGKELFCMTLLKEAWVDREVIKATDENGKPDRSVFSVHAVIHDNVGFGITIEGVEQFAKSLTEDEKQARLYGIPSYMSGLVYPQFSRKYKPTGHLVERFAIPTDWMVDIAIDVHPRKPQAVLFRATAPNGDRYLCDEIYEYGDGKWLAEEIIRLVHRNVYRVNDVIIDPLAKGDSNQDNTTYDTIAQILMRYDIALRVASKDKDSGIISVKNHLKGPNKEPSLFFFDDLRRTIVEIEGYMYEDKGERKGKPSKEDDDMMENLYRLSLIDTKWFPFEVNFEPEYVEENRNSMTGY